MLIEYRKTIEYKLFFDRNQIKVKIGKKNMTTEFLFNL